MKEAQEEFPIESISEEESLSNMRAKVRQLKTELATANRELEDVRSLLLEKRDWNLNDSVLVALATPGKATLGTYLSELLRSFVPEGRVSFVEDFISRHKVEQFDGKPGDLYKFTLWELMSIFGKDIRFGDNPPFVDNRITKL
jgi:hypothetical protein